MKVRLYSILAAGLLAMLTYSAVGQDFQSGYFLGGYTNAFRMNPAIQNERTIFAVGLGNIGVGIHSNQLGINTFLYERNGKKVAAFSDEVSSETFLGKLSDVNNLGALANLDVLTLGFWSKRNYWTIDIRGRADLQVSAPRDLFAFLKDPTSMQSRDLSGTELGLNGMMEAALGVSHNFNNKFNVGGRVKFLYGVASARILFDQMQTTFENDKVAFDGHGTLEASSPAFHATTGQNGYLELESLTGNFDAEQLKSPGGLGAAVDLGATWNILPWITVSGAVLDLGAMKWNREVYGETSTHYEWELNSTENGGADADAEEALESLMKFKRTSVSGSGLSMLPVTANLGAEVRIPSYQRLSFGILGTLKHSEICDWMEGRFSVNWNPANVLGLTVNTTLNNLGQSLGWALNFHPGGINLFLGMDYLPLNGIPVGDLSDSEDMPEFVSKYVTLPGERLNFNLYFGLNLAFGKRRLDYARRFIEN